jgi:hypothetical protein
MMRLRIRARWPGSRRVQRRRERSNAVVTAIFLADRRYRPGHEGGNPVYGDNPDGYEVRP